MSYGKAGDQVFINNLYVKNFNLKSNLITFGIYTKVSYNNITFDGCYYAEKSPIEILNSKEVYISNITFKNYTGSKLPLSTAITITNPAVNIIKVDTLNAID